jgi:hypothetical protein
VYHYDVQNSGADPDASAAVDGEQNYPLCALCIMFKLAERGAASLGAHKNERTDGWLARPMLNVTLAEERNSTKMEYPIG